jgi:hypothetical protein
MPECKTCGVVRVLWLDVTAQIALVDSGDLMACSFGVRRARGNGWTRGPSGGSQQPHDRCMEGDFRGRSKADMTLDSSRNIGRLPHGPRTVLGLFELMPPWLFFNCWRRISGPMVYRAGAPHRLKISDTELGGFWGQARATK